MNNGKYIQFDRVTKDIHEGWLSLDMSANNMRSINHTHCDTTFTLKRIS